MESIRKRGNKYQVRVNYYDLYTHKRKPITKTFNTKAEARKWAAKVESDTDNFILLDNQSTLEAWIDIYLSTYRLNNIANSTYQNEVYTKKRIIKFLKKVYIKDITPMMYQQFLNWMNTENYSKSTAKQTRLLLHNVFEKAKLQGATSSNPCLVCNLPNYKLPKKIEWLEAHEVKDFLNLIKKRNIYQYFVCYTAIELGCRVGEVLALKISDYDLKKQTVHICKSYDQKRDVFGKTKNKENRTVDFSTQYKNIVINFLNLQNTNKILNKEVYNNEYDLLHVDEFGKVIALSSLYNSITYIGKKYFKKSLSMHKLRHTHASLLLEDGAEMKYIQNRLGHSSDKITSEVYVHMTDKMRQREKDKYQKYFDIIFNERGGQ
ncbi:tyrosine-type recombinase/integrase [Staphylococcus schweitzeri]|uniref:Integrase family protein n=1 Tax=Staphylococcus schweitzeri TaxID=1654388 RepID=A0A077UD94_9STAP|nr:site-specific integrase [Staphylococcus schweitzeri]CDR26486.1 integrase family protein [Staphylococcus schweitzeri]